jgi:hypothetical protein
MGTINLRQEVIYYLEFCYLSPPPLIISDSGIWSRDFEYTCDFDAESPVPRLLETAPPQGGGKKKGFLPPCVGEG